MPLKRTPPTSPKVSMQNIEGSVVMNLENTLDIEDVNKILKHKRKRSEDNSSNLTPLLNQIQNMLDALKKEQDLKFDTLHSALKEQQAEFQRTIDFLSTKYDEMNIKLTKLEDVNRKSNIHIKQLEDKIERLEFNSRSASIEIHNIPESKSETKDVLRDLVKNIGNIIQYPLRNECIHQIYRNKTKQNTNSSIVVQFTTTEAKETIIRKSKKFNISNNSNHLNTSHLKINGPAKLIFISEHLSPKTKHLHYLTRQFAKEQKFKYCWISFGRIYLRKKEGDIKIRINSEKDLNNLSSTVI